MPQELNRMGITPNTFYTYLIESKLLILVLVFLSGKALICFVIVNLINAIGSNSKAVYKPLYLAPTIFVQSKTNPLFYMYSSGLVKWIVALIVILDTFFTKSPVIILG